MEEKKWSLGYCMWKEGAKEFEDKNLPDSGRVIVAICSGNLGNDMEGY